MDHPDFKALDFSGLKVTNSGGTALVKATAERWEKLTGCRIVEGYGLTETSPVASANPCGSLARLGTVGTPVPGTAMKVISDDGVDLGLGERGELCVKGPQVMKGYWQNPQATAEVLDAEGWFRTGDVAVIDPDGFVRIVDRSKDVVKSGGEWTSAPGRRSNCSWWHVRAGSRLKNSRPTAKTTSPVIKSPSKSCCASHCP